MGGADAGQLVQQHLLDVGGGAIARRGNPDSARIAPGGGDEIGQAADRAVGVYHQHRGDFRHHPDMGEIAHRIIGQVAIQGGPDPLACHIRHQQGVTIRGGLRHHRRPDGAAGAGAVLDHHRLAKAFAHAGSDKPRHHIGGATRWKGHDQTDRPCRPGLGMRCGGGGKDKGEEGRRGKGVVSSTAAAARSPAIMDRRSRCSRARAGSASIFCHSASGARRSAGSFTRMRARLRSAWAMISRSATGRRRRVGQQGGLRLALHHRCEMGGQFEGVVDAAVHAHPRRRVEMRGIARQHQSALDVIRYDPLVDAIGAG